MRLILQNWIDLVNIKLNPGGEHLSSLTEEAIQILKLQSGEEQDKVRESFIAGMFQRTKLKDKEQWIQFNQVMLRSLMDKLHGYYQFKEQQPGLRDLYKAIQSHLENSLNFLKDFFRNYFDYNEKIPLSWLIDSLQELSGQVDLLQKTVQPYKPYIHALADILVNNFTIFLQEKKTGATYNEMFYQMDLIHQLLINKTIRSEDSINEVLFYFNYNDHDYIAYLKEKLNDLTESLETTRGKIAALRFEQKRFNQLPVRLIGNLNPDTPSLLKQIDHWIEEEIKFLIAADIENEVGQPEAKEKVYVNVPFKASEIYLLHKSFIDSGGAPGETYKSFFEKTAAHLTNKNQKGFSIESLQKNSDKVNYESKENVKRFLQKMIRNIDSY